MFVIINIIITYILVAPFTVVINKTKIEKAKYLKIAVQKQYTKVTFFNRP